jgi:hypothetical protein
MILLAKILSAFLTVESSSLIRHTSSEQAYSSCSFAAGKRDAGR